MEFTGERFIPTEPGRIRLEHYHRYAITLDAVADKTVLDLACGEGYGSFIIAGVAHSVVGVDISVEAVRHAAENYQKTNLEFQKGSAINLEFPDASFDAVVSFETIEHLAEQSQMIAEIRRVLRPNGILIMSSPNRPIYSEESGEKNEFHVKELDFDEFDGLLKAQFPAVRFYGQRMLMGSVIQSFEGGQEIYKAWHDDGKNLIQQSGALRDPVYFVAVAGADESALPKIDPSIIYPNDLDLVKHYVGFAKWAQELNLTVAQKDKHIESLTLEVQTRDRHIIDLDQMVIERNRQIIFHRDNASQFNERIASLEENNSEYRREIAELERTVTELNAQIVSLEQETVRRGEWALGLKAELAEERENLDSIINSHSWRLTVPLREVRHWISTPKHQSGRYLKKSLNTAKRIYQGLPIEAEKTENHRNFLAKFAPKLLVATKTRLDGSEPGEMSSEIILEAENLNHSAGEVILKTPSEQIRLAKNIKLKTSDEPLVSVIIPIYGKIDYTLNCLASIAENPPQVSFEVIIIDDRSPDNSVEVLSHVKDLRLIENGANKGFIRSCNLGAKAAWGEYLYFLNNDTKVTSGWMDELVRTFHDFPGTGLVGSKLVYPDGRLQEAGGIIWQDGSAWNFGRLQDPRLPVFNYVREVDYCSGASVVVPKSIYDELDGFDEHYLPAYCEDSDLALKIRDAGYRVIYQPLSTVIHYEGITSGTDLNSGVKAYQVTNTKKQYARWKERLSKHQPAGVDVDDAKDRRAKRRILVLEHCTPTPNQDAGSLIVFNLLLLLREMDFQVTFIPEDNFLYMPEYTAALQRVGIEVLYAPFVTSVEQHLKEHGGRYDSAFLFRPAVVERNIEAVRHYCPQAKVIYHTQDLHFLRMLREAELFQDAEKAAAAAKMKLVEFNAINACEAVIVVSEKELELIRDEFPQGKLHTLPLILDVPGTKQPFADRRDIVFVGSFQHPPNVDAVKYFVSDVMPLLRRDLPNVRFFAVGSNPPDEIKELASDDVIITGFIEDLNSFLDTKRVSVAPLRYGAGIKGKIGTAMAVGLPVVATGLAVEGMSLTGGENILVADDPESFAKAIFEIYENESFWNKISRKSLESAKNMWGAEPARRKISDILAGLGIAATTAKYPLSLYSEFNVSDLISDEKPTGLFPVARVENKSQFDIIWGNGVLAPIRDIEKLLINSAKSEAFEVDGFCVPCNRKVSFLVDMKSGGYLQEKIWIPNWRERLECPICKMNNRQRLITTLVKQILHNRRNKSVYLMEQVTPIFKWVSETFVQHKIIGSEYLSFEYEGGTTINGIRHEDAENMSFGTDQFDLILSNDVFEHVPNPAKAFAECARVLKRGGIMLATIPFHADRSNSAVRAKVKGDKLEHLLPPVYHGNPLSSDGSLVFTDFGWDILNSIKSAGFSEVVIGIYASKELGHLGGQIVFEAKY